MAGDREGRGFRSVVELAGQAAVAVDFCQVGRGKARSERAETA